jgi:exodeoxyribonuclease V beta subunit
MQTLDAQTVPLVGTNLIEASAGTGKTWTISWLYLRLIAVEGLKVDQVLVVTYTEAATAELRDRIRKRLAEALAVLEGRSRVGDYQALLSEVPLMQACERLQLALVSFDEAAVFTIHGFCKRMLTDNAFEARLPFQQELLANEDALLTELTDQFWYQHFLQPDALHLALLQQYALTPDKLLQDVKKFIGKAYLREVMKGVDQTHFAIVRQTYQQQFLECRHLWQTEFASIRALFQAAFATKTLHAGSYPPKNFDDWCEIINQLFVQQKLNADALKVLEKFSAVNLQAKVNKGKAAPSHAFFEAVTALLIAYREQQAPLPQALESLRLQLLRYLRRELPKRKQQLGVLTFDDLLSHLQAALRTHPLLAQRLADQYQAALIDEFQDTDPIQYDIFAHIYRGNPQARVFFVGDPKQAIYGFRGADIYTYLKAAKETATLGSQYTLEKNFRSHSALLTALNHLFKQSRNPFLSEIAYTAVEAGQDQATLQTNDARKAIRWWDWDRLEHHPASLIEDNLASAVADDIATLLNDAQQGLATIGARAVESRDIAVLVRTGKQGDKIKQALLERGIASVQKTRESIFCTREAHELRTLLRAVAEPGNEVALRQALVTELLGYNAAQLLALDEDTHALETELEAFHQWHQLWHAQGFMPMFRHFMQQRRRYAHLLALADGERRLTNFLHLAELIHTESRLQGHGMHALIRWLQQRADAAADDETHQLRLESDENLVQIVTIHKSKGLEYGIVYCPYLWNESIRTDTWFSSYDDSNGDSYLQATQLADDAELARYRQAAKAENLRLLYVALTRAKYHCTIALVSGRIDRFDYYSALGWLLFGELPQHAGILGQLLKGGMQVETRQTLMQEHMQGLVEASAQTMSYESLPMWAEPVRYQPTLHQQAWQVRQYQHRLPFVPKVGSFSGLTSGKDDEKPDYDVLVLSTPTTVLPAPQREAFPRGTQAGSCLHKMLEDLDFTQSITAQSETVLLPALQRHGLAAQWLNAAETLLSNTLQTPLLADGLRLADLPKAQRLDELEFFFPVQQLALKPLQHLLHQHLPAQWQAIHAAIDKLKFNTLTGYMKGFVDLIFEHEGRYYIVDYKSNALGETLADYTAPAMQQAMADHHYYLQYLIYCLALHRYLRQRLADYAWETHSGGVLYLFLRGMTPTQVASGAFCHQPNVQLISALDTLMQ